MTEPVDRTSYTRPAQGVVLWQGDCLSVLRRAPDASVDAIVTDPPYGLSNTDPAHVVQALVRWANGDREFVPEGRGFMGKSWDAFVPPPAVWDECLRVLKPGGHLLCFAGTRTMDLMTLSIRLAGFDIRDSIAWLYGSGFPKSQDVGKFIDKHLGAERTVPAGVKPGHENFVGRDNLKSLRESGTMAGEGGFSRPWMHDAAQVEAAHHVMAPATPEAEQWNGWGTALKPAFEPIVVARKPLGTKTVAANVLAHNTGALDIDGCRVHADDVPAGRLRHGGGSAVSSSMAGPLNPDVRPASPAGRWPTNVVIGHAEGCEQTGECAEGCQVRALDEQSGTLASGKMMPTVPKGTRTTYGQDAANGYTTTETYGDTGGASRFFPTFRYQAKAPTRERPVHIAEDGTKTAHPTVKPLALMRWLVRLVTPPGGKVLDPFAGSGTTLEAALTEGMRAVGIEREASYLPLIEQRLTRNMTSDTPTEESA